MRGSAQPSGAFPQTVQLVYVGLWRSSRRLCLSGTGGSCSTEEADYQRQKIMDRTIDEILEDERERRLREIDQRWLERMRMANGDPYALSGEKPKPKRRRPDFYPPYLRRVK